MVSTSSHRSIIGRVLATNHDKPIKRFVGTTDVHGAGTMHAIHSVDPIVLCDMGEIKGVGLPKFGMHPHYGVIACSIVMDGGLTDKDNLGASPKGNTMTGGVYCASSGRGVCHDETTIEEYNRLFQVVLRIPESNMDMQPQITKCAAKDLPEVQEGVTLLVGELNAHKSPATPDAWPDAALLRVKVSPGSSISLPLPEQHRHGFCVVLDGQGTIAGEPVRKNYELVLFGEGHALEVTADGDQPLDMFVACGAPMLHQPWVKKLWNNGFGCFRNEQEANEIVEKATAAGNEWSFKVLDGGTN